MHTSFRLVWKLLLYEQLVYIDSKISVVCTRVREYPTYYRAVSFWLRRFFWKVGVGYYYYSCKQKFYSMHIMHTVNTLLCILLT